MKKIISTLLVCVLLVGSIFSLASCSTMVVGKYQAETEINLLITKVSARVTYEFGVLGNVTKTIVYGTEANKESEVTEGKYTIDEVEDGKFEITFVWDAAEGEEADQDIYSFVQGKDSAGKYVEIAGIRYDAVD